MRAASHLGWPFFDERHRVLGREIDAWAKANLAGDDEANVDAACRGLVRSLGGAGWLRHATRDGRVLGAGTVVTTGTWVGVLDAAAGDLVQVEFDGIGSAEVQL